MFVRAHSLEARGLLRELMATLVRLAEDHLDWPLPGYTHLQRAQPVYLSHHLLAYFWKFRRDLQRFNFCMTATDDLPLGAGRARRRQLRHEPHVRRPGARLRRRRRELARRRLEPRLRARLPLGGGHLRDPPVAAGRRDRALVEPGVRLLRGLGRLLVGLEPDAAEEEPGRRGAAAREGAARRRPARRASTGSCTACRSPTTRTSRRTRRASSTPPTRSSCRCAWRARCSARSASTASGWPAAASDEFIAATDIADHLVREGVPFREAHGIVGGIVRAAVERGKQLSELTEEELAELAPQLDGALLRAARAGRLARVQGLDRRHRARSRPRPARAGAPRAGRGGALRLERDFYARSVHDVARDLIGCTVRHGGRGRAHRRDRELPHGRGGLPRPRRGHEPHEHAVRPARAGLRVLLLRRALAAERGGGGRGRRRRGADQGARAGRRASS